MNMKDILSITRKGQTTLPAELRRKLGLGASGGVLRIRLDEEKEELIISKAATVSSLSERISQHIKPGTKPLLEVDDYYQANRQNV